MTEETNEVEVAHLNEEAGEVEVRRFFERYRALVMVGKPAMVKIGMGKTFRVGHGTYPVNVMQVTLVALKEAK